MCGDHSYTYYNLYSKLPQKENRTLNNILLGIK